MTDEQIIKAFKCITYGEIDKCLRCPYDVYKECETFVYEDALELIKRQQAEIDRLETNCLSMAQTMPNMAKAERAKAIKEFAEKLKEKAKEDPFWYIHVDDIDNLVKEMVGGTDV